ncbi:MAG: pyrrolo-quinoline quinone [Planctomycetes bacterium]|nr:pyrrolo-quinoline quinone [Planctomycetota bacterium]
MRLRPYVFCSILVLLAAFGTALSAADSSKDWPSFRGPDRTGVARETGLLRAWPENGPRLVWQGDGAGRGYASLAIAGDRIYTLGDSPSTAEDKDEYLSAFDRKSGKLLWQTKTGPAWTSGQESWQSSRSTPTIDGPRVYVLTPHGVLVCCDAAIGKEFWKRDLKAEFEGRKGDPWGYSESVLVDGDRLICTPGGEKNTMVALDKKTGATLWTADRANDRGAGHASAVIATVGKDRVYVQVTASGPMGVRASDGKLLWFYDIEKTTAVIPTPIVRDDLVFFSVGYGRGGALLKQVPSADGGVKIEEIYGLNTELNNKHGGVILIGDHLYGDSNDQGIPFCAELMTGKVVWKKRASAGSGSASLAGADGMLFIHFANGTMALAAADPSEFKELSTFKLPKNGNRPSWSHPVIVDGKLMLREDDLILCYDLLE